MSRVLAVVAAALALVVPSPGSGAEPPEDSPFGDFTWSFGGGASAPVIDAQKRFNLGGQFQITLGYRVFSRLVLQAEYHFSTHGISADFLEGDSFSATHYVHAGTLGVRVSVLPARAPFELYVVGGPGFYGRTVEIGTQVGGPVPAICEPELLLCNTGVAGVSSELAKATLIDFGANAGVGASIPIGLPVRLFIESRFHFIWGTLETPEGSRSANGQYIPITIGFQYF